MKAFNRLLIVFIIIAALLMAAVNVLLAAGTDASGRQYRVDAARAAAKIESEGMEGLDLSLYPTLAAVVPAGEDGVDSLLGGKHDCVIKEIGGEYYRFDYIAPSGMDSGDVLAVNIALGVMAAVMAGFMLYLRRSVIKPMYMLRELPYELSKGNLTMPLKESRHRFFGRFVWGMDMLRERLEQHRSNEISLQSERKKLILSLSHDVRIPLSAIKLYSRALSGKLYDSEEKQLEAAIKINEKADEIEELMSRIVTASREDFLSLEVERGEFYLSEMVDKVSEYYSDKLRLLKIDFSVGSCGNCLIKGDLDRAVEVMQNIMENAVKYGDGKSISMTFSEEEGCRLVTVSNTGCSLPEGELPHMFDSFWRGSNASGESGSGLGLYICRCLMNKMGGEVFAEIKDGNMRATAVFSPA